MKKTAVILFALMFFCSCKENDLAGMFVGSGPDVNERFANSRQAAASSPIPDIVLEANEYRVYIMTDAHSTGVCPALDGFVSACLGDTTVEKFAFNLGDLVSGRDCFPSVRKNLQPLFEAGRTLFSTPGNHDLYFSQYGQYRELFPLSTYQFRVVTASEGSDLFIVLDSADGKLGTAQRSWLEDVLADARKCSYRNIYVLTHTHFFRKNNSDPFSGSFALEETMYLTSLFAEYGVSCVLSGHDHHYGHTRYRNVDYYVLSALSDSPGIFYRAVFGKSLGLEEIVLR